MRTLIILVASVGASFWWRYTGKVKPDHPDADDNRRNPSAISTARGDSIVVQYRSFSYLLIWSCGNIYPGRAESAYEQQPTRRNGLSPVHFKRRPLLVPPPDDDYSRPNELKKVLSKSLVVLKFVCTRSSEDLG